MRKWIAPCELLTVLAIFVAEEYHLVPLSKTPFLLFVGWLSLRLRRIGWRNVGLRAPGHWPKALVLGSLAGAGIQALEQRVLVPLMQWLTGELPDVSDFRPIVGNLTWLVVALALSWIGSLGEELVYRGYLMNRVAELLGGQRGAWALSLLLVNVGFGLAHISQGLSGQIENAVSGLLLGLVYLAAGRNLWAAVVAHGVSNTLDFLLIFWGRYPGI